MTEKDREEEEYGELLAVMRDKCDEETLIILYKWEFLDMPAEHHDRIMIDSLLKVMKERGIQIPTVLPDGQVDYGKYDHLKDYDLQHCFADMERIERANLEKYKKEHQINDHI